MRPIAKGVCRAVNKAMEFVLYVTTTLNLAELSATE